MVKKEEGKITFSPQVQIRRGDIVCLQSFVAQILEMDDDAMQAPLLFMKKDDKHESLYFWPTDDDISWESYSQILVV